MPALSLRSERAMVLSALLASILGVLLLAPVAFAGGAGPPLVDQYGGGAGPGPPQDGSNDPNSGGNAPSGGGAGSRSGGSTADGTSLGPDPSVSPADEGASGGGSDLSTDSGSSDDGSGNSSDGSGNSSDGSGNSSDDDKDSKSSDGRSLGEILSGGTERVTGPAASTGAGARAARGVSEDGGGAGLLWLLLALGAVTAVAAGGVAVRRRQARQGHLD